MANKKLTRLLALIMAVVCTLTVVSAAVLYDENGDDKVTVWDLQALLGKTNYNAAVKKALGGGDELNPVDGVYEIWTELGLRNMAKNASKGYTFNLMANIDLGGMDWTPVADFKGTFNGNDHKISNFTITKHVKDGSAYSMGFFGDTENVDDEDVRTSINDLHLEDVQIVATSNAQFIGAIVGTNRSDIVNCTAVSAVTDLRTDAKSIYYGTIAGRNANYTPEGSTTQTVLGKIDGTNELDTTVNITAKSDFTDTVFLDKYADAKTVNSKIAVFFSEDLDYETEAAYRNIGIAGFTGTTGLVNKDMRWQDITNSTDLAPQVLQDRREVAAAEMYEMCTVEWTPSTAYSEIIAPSVADKGQGTGIEYYRYTGDATEDFKPAQYFAGGFWYSNKWYSGGVYRGIPYNHGSSNLDRFNYWVNNADLPSKAYYITDPDVMTEINTEFAKDNLGGTTTSGYTVPETMSKELVSGVANNVGFNQYIGADCASQAAWAWRKISAVTGTDFANPQTTSQLYLTASSISTYGLVAVNGLVFENPGNLDGDENTSDDSGDKCIYLSNYLTENTAYWWDTLALTSKGDFLMEYSPDGGHTRVALSDAVVIYTYNKDAKNQNTRYELNKDLSYIVTAEQGGNGQGVDSDGICHYSDVTAATPWRSSCCVDRRMTFADLTTDTKGSDGYYRCWFPITCSALRDADSAAGNVTFNMDDSGKVTSNFQIVSTTVNGNVVYTGTDQTGSRNRVTSVTLSSVHGDIAAGATVTVRLANGKDYTGVYGTAGLTEVK